MTEKNALKSIIFQRFKKICTLLDDNISDKGEYRKKNRVLQTKKITAHFIKAHLQGRCCQKKMTNMEK